MKHLKLYESINTGSKFIAKIFQSGGCDYTIECGTKVIKLESTDIDDAIEEISSIISEEYTGDFKLSKATLYEIKSEQEINLKDIYDGVKKRKDDKTNAEKERKDREDFERLSKKYGNK